MTVRELLANLQRVREEDLDHPVTCGPKQDGPNPMHPALHSQWIFDSRHEGVPILKWHLYYQPEA